MKKLSRPSGEGFCALRVNVTASLHARRLVLGKMMNSFSHKSIVNLRLVVFNSAFLTN